MDGIPLWVFAPVWLAVLSLARVLTGRIPGLTVFFAAVTALYMLLPVFFYAADAPFFVTILIGCGLAIVGFWLGLTALTALREPWLALATDTPLESRRLCHTAAVLISVGVIGVVLANPRFFEQVGTYEGRVAFQSGRGIEPFLLNQAVVGLGALVLAALQTRRWGVALSGSALGAAWAVYSSNKLSLLVALAAWFAWWIASIWRGERRARTAWLGMILLPLILPALILYSVLRAGVGGDLPELIGAGVSSLDRLGDAGIMVGDFDGPYRVLMSALDSPDGAVLLGWTYLSQLPVLVPRALRGDFTDLAESYARLRLGENWRPGTGFSFSPWAEGVSNLGIPGFLIEGVLFGLLIALLVRTGRAALGSHASVILYCLVPQIVLFQRGYLIGVVKNVVVYAAPFVCAWLALGWLGRIAAPAPSPSTTPRPVLADQP